MLFQPTPARHLRQRPIPPLGVRWGERGPTRAPKYSPKRPINQSRPQVRDCQSASQECEAHNNEKTEREECSPFTSRHRLQLAVVNGLPIVGQSLHGEAPLERPLEGLELSQSI